MSFYFKLLPRIFDAVAQLRPKLQDALARQRGNGKALESATLETRGCLCDNWKPRFLARLIFNIFEASYSTLVKWEAKSQVSTNQNSRNNWYEIVRRTIWWCSKYVICRRYNGLRRRRTDFFNGKLKV